MSALSYLQQREWTMGNGQCHECCGVGAGFYGHPLHRTRVTIGHKANCPVAAAIKELGGKPIMVGEFDGPMSERNALMQPYFDAYNKQAAEEFDKRLFEALGGKVACLSN